MTTTITPRDNLLAVLRGDEPAWVPFSINFWQWFEHHRAQRSLPAELAGCTDYLDAMLALGCDIFSRNLDGGIRCRSRTVPETVTTAETAIGTRRTVSYATPHGILTAIHQGQRAITTEHQETYMVKSWETDRAAFLAWFDGLEFSWDVAVAERVIARIGDQGLLNLPLAQSPLKFLHQCFGLDGSCLFIADHPEEAQSICDAFWARVRPVIEQVARHPGVASVILMDNVDTPFYPPRLAERFWGPYVADAAAIMHAQGKHLFVHACGKLRRLGPVFAGTRVDGLEGVSHAPLGDWNPQDAVACHDRFVYVGGFSGHEQSMPDGACCAEHYHRMLSAMPRRRVIFASSCQTAVETPWERILQVRELVRRWGGAPAGRAVAASA